MHTFSRNKPFLLFLGDIIVFYASLWLTLVIRYEGNPSGVVAMSHVLPFTILFVISTIVFFIAGLYEKRAVMLRKKIPGLILNAQITNSVIAIAFFYFIPYFLITPKVNLFVYLIISSCLLLAWRMYIYLFFINKERQKAILVGSGVEMRELKDEINSNPRYGIEFISCLDLEKLENIDFKGEFLDRIYGEEVSVIVVDLNNEKVEPLLPHLYNLIFSKVRFIDMYKVYEDTFDRTPLSLLRYNWFLENISASPNVIYDTTKRFMDILISFVLGIISLVIYPFVFFAIKFEDGGPVFIIQERVGKNNIPVKIIKFRSMSRNDQGEYSSARAKGNVVTKVGGFLRKTRIDELPQLWNVLQGHLSLIGPRPELPALVKRYEEEIPYYNIRHLIKPGLSGWAQIYHDNHPHHGEAVNATKEKLSYDLYYIENRSMFVDLKIALRTIQKLISRSGK